MAALIANSVLAAAMFALYHYQPGILEIVTWEVMTATALTVFGFGILFTWICTYISVNKFLKMKAGKIYKI